MAVVSILWALFGYSLAFDAGTASSAACDHVFLHGVGTAPDPDYADHSRADVDDLPDDVRHHHAGADLRARSRSG